MSEIQVACIGTGYFSQFHYDAWRRIEDAKLVASVSLSKDEAERTGLPAFSTAGQMLANTAPDLVDIITPPSSHFSLIEECASGGVKTIICQKPFCNSLEEAKSAIDICKVNDTTLGFVSDELNPTVLERGRHCPMVTISPSLTGKAGEQ